MEHVFIKLVQLFFIGAFSGWVLELFFRRWAHKKWVNPGFLVGPWLPLYGTGVVILHSLSLINLSFIPNIVVQKIVLIVIITIAMTLLEYITGLIFIKGMNVKLWDYSDRKGNVDGIICPLFSLIWGVIGALYNLLLFNPLNAAISFLSEHIASYFVAGMLFSLFIVDNAYSFHLVSKIKNWAKEHQVIVKYEQFKINIKQNAQNLKKKTSFVFSLKGPSQIVEELNRFLSEKGKGSFEKSKPPRIVNPDKKKKNK